jgi:hypothetical protein
MKRKSWAVYSLVLAIAIGSALFTPLIFGLLSEMSLFGVDHHRVWSDVSWVVACVVVGLPAALLLRRFVGDQAMRAAVLAGLLTFALFASIQLVFPPPWVSTGLRVRGWILNAIRAISIPLFVIALRLFDNRSSSTSNEDTR